MQMEDIDKAISTLQELSRSTHLDQGQTLKRKFEVLAGSTAKESLTSECMSSIYRLNEETKALVQKVDKLLNRGKFSEGIALDAFEEKRGDMLPPCKLAGETTAIRNMEKIYDLINGDVRKIGVYGMGGIGKTTVIRHINNRILEEKNEKFKRVIWVTVSKESSVFKLQHDLGFKLNVNLSNGEDSMTRAAKLFEAFQKIGRYLLILDDLWEAFGLEKVGIPDPDYPSSSNGGKLVLTTRSLDVCRIMKCQQIKMDLLSEEEAWDLFLDHVGLDVLQFKGLEPIMRDVASECARLPLAIAVIATSMRGNEEACDWRDALAKLRAFSKEPDDEGKRVIERLKFSYDSLKNKKLQKCLLLCALYPEDFCIERRELVELLALEGIIEEKDSKRDEIDEGNAMLNKLINQCLLEGGTDEDGPWVKMHDLVRDMALQIDNLHSQYKTISDNELRKLENVTWSENLLKLHVSNCYSLNASPVCSRLTTFVLHDFCLRNIPDSFFLHLKALKVLSLSGCPCLKVLPNSIFDLVNLVGLLFRDCCYHLKCVPSLTRLKNLLTLDISISPSGRHYRQIYWKKCNGPITRLEGLNELTNLRYLNLSSPIIVVPSGVLSKLQKLRYLICCPFTVVSVKELMRLENLEVFEGGFHDIHDLRVYVKHMEQKRPRLTSYIICVGFTYGDLPIHMFPFRVDSFDKVVVLGRCNLGEPPAENDDMYLLPKDVQVLQMIGFHDITNFYDVPSLKYAVDLQTCIIIHCYGIRELFSASSSSSFVLGSLEWLNLQNLENMEAVIGGKMELCNIFSCLKKLEIVSCSRMKVVFDIALVSYLNNLEILVIGDCNDLTVIIRAWLDNEVVNENMAEISLPKLRKLELVKLPHLRSICPAPRGVFCKSLREIKIEDCPQLEQCVHMPSHDDTSPSPSLRLIELKQYNRLSDYSQSDSDTE